MKIKFKLISFQNPYYLDYNDNQNVKLYKVDKFKIFTNKLVKFIFHSHLERIKKIILDYAFNYPITFNERIITLLVC